MFLTQEWVQEQLSSVWPGWKISRKLGSGTYGSVYEIYRGHPGMEGSGTVLTSALKVLYMEETDPEDPPTVSLLQGGRAAALGKKDDPGFTRDINLNAGSAVSAGGLYGGGSGKEDLLFQSVSGSMIDDFVNSVRTEINLMIRLKGHPHIVSIEDYEVLRDDRSCLILIRMDELDCLADIIGEYRRSGRRMEQTDVIRLGMEICEALDYCERSNIIHRDIKPSNLFYSERTGFKLGDFGISRTMDSIYDRAAMSGIGTPQYMAPEIYHGEKYNNSADLYSLGIVLYALTNDFCIPFARENYEACGDMRLRDASLRRIRGEKFPPPRSADEKLGQVIMRACAYDPQDRFRTARELCDALKGCLPGKTGSEEKGTGRCRNKKGRGKEGQDSENSLKKWANLAAAAAVIVLILFIFGIGPRLLDTILHPEVKYTVSYVDDAGNVLEEHTYKGREGEVITQSAQEREGYLRKDKTLSMTLAKDNSENRLVFTYVREETQTEAAAAAEKEEAEKAAAAEKEEAEKAVAAEETAAEKEAAEKEKAVEAAELVEWTDSNLKKAVQDYLGIKGEMTREAAAKVKILELKSAGITDISSLKYFTGLEKLRLNDNNISDLLPVSGMRKLNLLNAEMNRISDLSPLSKMTALRGLDLNENQISDLSPLKDLTGMTMVDVRRNQVRSLEPLKGMIDMEELYVSYNQIEDLSPVAGMTRLTYLAITDNKIKDISCLKNMSELAVLTMRDNQVTDISVLRNLKKIYHLKISGNPIKDYSPLDDYPETVHLEK